MSMDYETSRSAHLNRLDALVLSLVHSKYTLDKRPPRFLCPIKDQLLQQEIVLLRSTYEEDDEHLLRSIFVMYSKHRFSQQDQVTRGGHWGCGVVHAAPKPPSGHISSRARSAEEERFHTLVLDRPYADAPGMERCILIKAGPRPYWGSCVARDLPFVRRETEDSSALEVFYDLLEKWAAIVDPLADPPHTGYSLYRELHTDTGPTKTFLSLLQSECDRLILLSFAAEFSIYPYDNAPEWSLNASYASLQDESGGEHSDYDSDKDDLEQTSAETDMRSSTSPEGEDIPGQHSVQETNSRGRSPAIPMKSLPYSPSFSRTGTSSSPGSILGPFSPWMAYHARPRPRPRLVRDTTCFSTASEEDSPEDDGLLFELEMSPAQERCVRRTDHFMRKQCLVDALGTVWDS